MIDDRHLEWMATLDWSVHGPGRPAMPSDGLPLQTALSHLAELATEPWPDGIDHFLSRAGNTPQGDWISSDEAFDAAGDPVQSFHATHGDRVRAMARTMRVPIASVDEITRDEWSAVELASVDYWEIGAGARHVWWALAPMFAKMAAGDDGVVIRVRPIGGGDEVPFGRSFWSKADPETVVRTLATCTVAQPDPFHPAAPATHRLFVERVGLERALKAAARESYISPIRLDDRLQRPIDTSDPGDALLLKHMRGLMTAENAATLTKDEIISTLEERLCCEVSDRLYARLRKTVLDDDPSLAAVFRRPGPRKGGLVVRQRPALRIVRSTD